MPFLFSSDSISSPPLHPRFNPQLKQLEKSISSRISLGNCRSTAFSWHFENNGWMSDSSLMILEVSVYGWIWKSTKAFYFISLELPLAYKFSLHFFFFSGAFLVQMKQHPPGSQQKRWVVIRTLPSFTIYSSVTWYQLSYFLYVWTLTKKRGKKHKPWNFLFPTPRNRTNIRWKAEQNKNLHRCCWRKAECLEVFTNEKKFLGKNLLFFAQGGDERIAPIFSAARRRKDARREAELR